MNFSVFFIFLFAILSPTVAKDHTISLHDDDFETRIKTHNFYVVFVKERQFNEFISFWSKIAELYNSDKKSRIKIASVNCNDNQKLCRNEGISELLQLKFFAIDGDDFEWQPIAEFINRTIHDTLENFRMQVATRNKLQDGKHFVKFFVPYCGHCKNMAPVWDELEDFFVKDTDVSLLSVDCTKSRSICDQYEVFRYPTMLWIEDGSVVEKYSGTRSFKYFKDYIENMLENSQPTAVATSSKKVEEESGILDLNSNDFNEVIAKDFTFVKFYMPRCSHCKEINKLWNVLARKFASSETIKIAQVNCVHNYDLCMEEAKGCPTLNVYGNGKLLVKDYYEDTTLEGLSDCIISNQKGGKAATDWKLRVKGMRRLRKEKERLEDEKAEKCRHAGDGFAGECN